MTKKIFTGKKLLNMPFWWSKMGSEGYNYWL